MPEVLTRVDEGDSVEWKSGSAAEFLGLTKEEEAIVKARLEHQRLQSAVVEAAKRRAVTSYTAFEMWNAIDIAFDDAVDALIAFEAEHKIGEG